MPAISVRDLQLKDDSTCICSDLIAGTHGRGYWILDDVTPLRQEAAAAAAREAYLYKPATAVRVRLAANDPTPWPPELPAGENPLPGGIIDYYLASDVSSPVTLDILDKAGKVVRSYSSTEAVRNPHPALDPEVYDRLCRANPTAEDCALPLYWPAPPMALTTKKGMHRFSWDLRYQPVAGEGGRGGGEGGGGAVPHHTYASVNAPWAPPGQYTVRLTVNGKSYTQPLTLRLDPRVKTPAAGLAQLNALTGEMYNGARDTHDAYEQARALAAKLASVQSPDAAALRARIDSIAPPPPAGGRGRGGRGGRGFGRGGGAPAAPTLQSVSGEMLGAAMAMQGADITPTSSDVAAVNKARADGKAVMAKWKAVSTAAAKIVR
ncbi:MAG TPA: hypothetical protein VHB25_00220, partial [Gemmatimonadaceae bacterium]|nr:hypothetical protein [Gemmatimonadaceae bacterium]